MFEHLLGLKPWDLERMTLSQVALRLAWIKKHPTVAGGEGDG